MLPQGYEKRSFIRFGVDIDQQKILDEYHSIPDEAWVSSYWGHVHCSVGMLLLRGGVSGTEADFFSDGVKDSPLLDKLPYIKSLIAEDGPFGGAQYAFLFKMEPDGVTLKHRDSIEKWKTMFRIHVPIVTNPGAHLVSDGRAIHFAVGHAWSFDNYSEHGVVNGGSERIHLIFDVEFNDVLKQRLDEASVLDGEVNEDYLRKIESEERKRPSYPGDSAMSEMIKRLRKHGLDDEMIATFFEAKGLPTKQYRRTRWDGSMIGEIEKA